MELFYSNDPCGAGKTYAAIDRIARDRGRYVLAVDRREIIPKRVEEIEAAAGRHNTAVRIQEIISHENQAKGETVGRLIKEAPKGYSEPDHAVVIVTHRGLMSSDLKDYGGWRLYIDEAPSIFTSTNVVGGPLTKSIMAEHFQLTELGDGTSAIGACSDLKPSDFDHFGHLREFHDLVRSGGARCQLRDWDDVLAVQQWPTWRTWSPHRLSAFSEVTILADAFQDHLTGLLMAKEPGIVLTPVSIGRRRAWKARKVVVEHYSEAVQASACCFQQPAFAESLQRIGHHIAHTAGPRHIWTTNVAGLIPTANIFDALVIPGERLSPMQAGSNAHRCCTEATMIYTANPSPQEVSILSGYGISADQIRDSRELYAIMQFMMRTAMRDPESQEQITLRVFSKSQSDRLIAKLAVSFPAFEFEQVFFDVGVVVSTKGQSKAMAPRLTAEQRKARQALYSARNYAKSKRAKTG